MPNFKTCSGLRCLGLLRRLCMELLLLFCPNNYDGVGTLLEYCDRPSIFQVIGKGKSYG